MLGRTAKRQNGRPMGAVGRAGRVTLTVRPLVVSSAVAWPALKGTIACHTRTKSGLGSLAYSAGKGAARVRVPVSNE